MSRPKLGVYIRKINYLSTKEDKEYKDDEETQGNQLIDYERLCDQDENFNFEELKDGYAAFREKVCIPKFTGRHSPPYWVAYSTACVLERLTRDFEDDESKHLQIGHELLYTWLALFCARPSSGQLDLMSNFTGGLFEKYIEACKADELVKIMSRMKIKFSYDAKNETDEERTYASFLSDNAKTFFQNLTEEQCAEPVVLEAFLDLRIFYQQQISKISPTLALYVGYLVRDMASKFKTNVGDPYKKLANVQVIVTHLSYIEESLCTFEGDLKALRDEETLNEIVKAARESSKVKELFPALMSLVTRFSKRKTPLQNGYRIFDVYRINLFRDMTKFLQPDGGMFESCNAMIKNVLTDGCELTKAKQDMIVEALSDCLLKVKNLTSSQAKDLLDALLIMLKSGRKCMINAVKRTLKTKEYTKTIEWKNLIAEAKELLNVVGTLKCDQLEYTESREYDEVLRELLDTVEISLELFKKGKILKDILNDHVTLIFNCLEMTEPNKA
ncbi:uncharacterized protein LOC123565796 isoform X2 [Mercenaria mercenaria]|uniref:uncharacterized protein LOC123565796 isoform X2 n=1 Tax=Mercenaria mercenaria TaxID=6596 RepID=UPI00234F7009|nr:uncharacterized protein LOC123565796 isoform X2 [Mercenaria mercenaria]